MRRHDPLHQSHPRPEKLGRSERTRVPGSQPPEAYTFNIEGYFFGLGAYGKDKVRFTSKFAAELSRQAETIADALSFPAPNLKKVHMGFEAILQFRSWTGMV